MRKFYLRKLKRNELGSPKSDGSTSRGRFFLLSKECFPEFFPYLSELQNNDSAIIPIITEFSEAKIYSRIVYHNSKYNTPDGDRDEHRLYLNKELDPDSRRFNVNDIVVFERIEKMVDDIVSPLYFLHTYSPSSEYYSFLNNIVETSIVKGSNAFYYDELGFIPMPDSNVEERPVVIPEDVKKEVGIEVQRIQTEEATTIEDTRGAHLFNSVSFRDFVLHGYGYKCAITEQSIVWKNLNNLEAAHIQPKAHTGTFLPCNGIALSRDMHWAFDKGFITISGGFRVIVHDEVKDSMLKSFANKKIIVPSDQFYQPEKKFLEYHRKNIYGLFLNSGSIRSVRNEEIVL